jgi:hypothetical protein
MSVFELICRIRAKAVIQEILDRDPQGYRQASVLSWFNLVRERVGEMPEMRDMKLPDIEYALRSLRSHDDQRGISL